jgi:hypothetical protein
VLIVMGDDDLRLSVVVYFNHTPLGARGAFVRPVHAVEVLARDAASTNVLAPISAARAVVMPGCTVRSCAQHMEELKYASGILRPVPYFGL